MTSITLQPLLEAIGPSAASIINAEDATINPKHRGRSRFSASCGGPNSDTDTGFQNAAGKSSTQSYLSVYVTVSDADARASDVTLRYWRTAMDDANGDGVPDQRRTANGALSIGFSAKSRRISKESI